jgi:3'-phosphoadenosine 5'-phosphosulfate sulfotransferase (PAPS reductase)/FAD synthetase
LIAQYVPKLFGLKIREYAEIHRWQDKVRDKMNIRMEEHENEKADEEGQ